MPPYPLANFDTRKYFQNILKLKDVYSRINLPKIKDKHT